MMVPLLRENTHLTVHSKGRMETIRTSHITQIRTSQPAGIAGRRPPRLPRLPTAHWPRRDSFMPQ